MDTDDSGTVASRPQTQAALKFLPIASAQPQSNVGLQDDFVLATNLKLQPANPIQIHDNGAVDAHEFFVADVALELGKCPPQNVRLSADMQAGVVARSLDPVDIRYIEEQHLTATFDDQSFCSL
jgi:hypothetical protein